ncbi:hypothetical protein RZE82_00965 [Mollicutes bacterium LVI A0039]|nr:hypothetical protein RZE82_00965 [Mollicutes bacterium LVI A0039]
MNLNKLILFLVAILAILIGGFTYINSQNFDLYTSANKVKYYEVLDDKEGVDIYYYYMSTCGYCNSIKDQVTDLYLATEETEGVSMKLVDLKLNSNSAGWAQDEEYDPALVDMTDVENIKITGTPAMIYVVDGEVVNYQAGGGVFEVMEQANSEFDLGLEFDPSKYGE